MPKIISNPLDNLSWEERFTFALIEIIKLEKEIQKLKEAQELIVPVFSALKVSEFAMRRAIKETENTPHYSKIKKGI